MIIVDVEQGTPEWFQARLGKPTASRFGDIVTPTGKLGDIVTATGKLSRSSEDYLYELAAEWLVGRPLDKFISDAMVHGTLTQPEATEYYEMRRSVDVEAIGFALDDAERYGASPDGLVGDSGTLEIKCPQQHTHMSVLMTGQVPTKHKPQVQGQLLVTGRDWCDFVSYHPEMPGEIIRVERDEAYIEALRDALEGFCDLLDQSKAQLQKRGFEPVKVAA